MNVNPSVSDPCSISINFKRKQTKQSHNGCDQQSRAARRRSFNVIFIMRTAKAAAERLVHTRASEESITTFEQLIPLEMHSEGLYEFHIRQPG